MPGPIAPAERIATIDILRGVAIFGILVENMLFFGGPISLWQLTEPWWPAPADQVVNAAVHWLEKGKFYALFSFLFGLGVTLQMQRVGASGSRFVRLYVRRMLTLLAIGLAHALLLWWGDILSTFAVLGFLLLLFRRASDKALLFWAVMLWLGPLMVILTAAGADELLKLTPLAAMTTQSDVAAQQAALREAAHQSVERYGAGSPGDIFAQRLADLHHAWAARAFHSSTIFMMFLLGMYAGRRGYLQNPDGHPRLHSHLLRWALPVGLLAHLGYALTLGSDKLLPMIANMVPFTIGLPLLTFGYIAAVVTLARRAPWRKLLAPLAAVGRMSLSNYLLQTVVCTTLFYSYGFGLYGRVSPTVGLIPTVLLYAAQVALSNWWLHRFRFGPVEWLWRSVTYAKWQPLRHPAA